METILAVILTIIFMVIFLVILFGFVTFFIFMRNRKNNIDILIREWTGGKPLLRREKCHIVDHRKYGEFIFIPRTHEILPRFRDEYFYPTNKTNRKFIDVTVKEKLYTANKARHISQIPKDIWKTYQDGNNQAIKPNLYEAIDFLITPVGLNARQFAFIQKEILNEKTAPSSGFWQKNGHYVVAIGVLSLTVMLCIIMIVFTYQYTGDIPTPTITLPESFFNNISTIVPKG